jgi:hypothetical protein
MGLVLARFESPPLSSQVAEFVVAHLDEAVDRSFETSGFGVVAADVRSSDFA